MIDQNGRWDFLKGLQDYRGHQCQAEIQLKLRLRLEFSGNPVAKNYTPACRERFFKIYEEQNSEKLVRITEKLLKDRDGEEDVS